MNKQLCICASLLLGGSCLACAQFEAPYPPPESSTAVSYATIVSSAPRDKAEGLIKLDVVATDAGGNPVAGLRGDDFKLLESGQPQKILSFQAFNGRGAGSEPPVKIILLIDTLDLPESLAREERNAVESYLRKNGGHLAHPVAVYQLADTGLWTAVHSSSDGNTLAHEVEHNEFARVDRPTAWQRGPSQSESMNVGSGAWLKALGRIAVDERTRPGRKLLLWVGPGWGIGSGAYVDAKAGSPGVFDTVWWFSTLMREAHIALYSFALGEVTMGGINRPITQGHGGLYKDYLDGAREPHKATLMNLYRKVLAVQSGGRVVDESLDVVQEIERCVQEAGSFYRISFDPFAADHANEYHDLKVVVDQPGVNARTTTGYYDQPYYSTDPIPVPRRLSLKQLQALLETDESDADLAKQLSGLELTERLSERRLSSFHAIVHGKRTRQELRILADASAFLDPPPDEILAQTPPDANTQQKMRAMMSEYLATTIHRLPDFFARRSTVRFQETSMYLEGATSISYRPLHLTDSATTAVRYHNGYEVADSRYRKLKLGDPQLVTYGVFGPALQDVLTAIDKSGGLSWSRWEQGSHGSVAVFRSVIPTDKSLRQVWVCCLPDGDGTEAFQRYAGYHVEIAIDPESGAIVRVAFQSDLKSTTPLFRSDIMIEYGPVEIGGQAYVCPLRSVSIVRGRSVRMLSEWDEAFRSYGPYTTMLNDISFDQYHLFRSESRILTGFTATEK